MRKQSTRNDVCCQISMIFMIFKEESGSRREDLSTVGKRERKFGGGGKKEGMFVWL